MFGLLIVPLAPLQKLIILLSPLLLLAFEILIQQLQPLLLVVQIGQICVTLRLLMSLQCATIRTLKVVLTLSLSIIELQGILFICCYLEMIDVSFHLLIDPLVVMIAIVHTL